MSEDYCMMMKTGVVSSLSSITMIIYYRHIVHIVGTVNNAWAQKMVSHNSLQNWYLHMITRIGKKILTLPQL